PCSAPGRRSGRWYPVPLRERSPPPSPPPGARAVRRGALLGRARRRTLPVGPRRSPPRAPRGGPHRAVRRPPVPSGRFRLGVARNGTGTPRGTGPAAGCGGGPVAASAPGVRGERDAHLDLGPLAGGGGDLGFPEIGRAHV